MFSTLTNHINQPIKIGLYLQKVGTKSVHFRYIISGIIKSLKIKKASIQTELKLFEWAQMDLNHRPSDYESDALTN